MTRETIDSLLYLIREHAVAIVTTLAMLFFAGWLAAELGGGMAHIAVADLPEQVGMDAALAGAKLAR